MRPRVIDGRMDHGTSHENVTSMNHSTKREMITKHETPRYNSDDDSG